MKRTLLIALTLLLVPATAAVAFSTASCHCFRNRSYDPADRFAADDYLVATTFNSLIAKSFHISKGRIVMMKMQGGIDPDDLLIGLYLAQKSGRELSLLLSVRENGGSWQEVLRSLNLKTTGPVLRALAKGADSREVAALVTDKMLIGFFGIDQGVTKGLRNQGFNGRQIAVICALAQHAKTKPQVIADMYRQKKMSWSQIAAHYHLTPKEVGKIIA